MVTIRVPAPPFHCYLAPPPVLARGYGVPSPQRNGEHNDAARAMLAEETRLESSCSQQPLARSIWFSSGQDSCSPPGERPWHPWWSLELTAVAIALRVAGVAFPGWAYTGRSPVLVCRLVHRSVSWSKFILWPDSDMAIGPNKQRTSDSFMWKLSRNTWQKNSISHFYWKLDQGKTSLGGRKRKA